MTDGWVHGPVPLLTIEQRRAGLEKGLQIRRARAEMLLQLKAGNVTLDQVLGNADDLIVARTRVSVLLAALPRVGPATAARLMDEVGIARSRRVKGLGPVQRETLLRAIATIAHP